MQYNRIPNEKDTYYTKTGSMAASQFEFHSRSNFNDNQKPNTIQNDFRQKKQTKDSFISPAYFPSKKPQSIVQSMIFNPTSKESSSNYVGVLSSMAKNVNFLVDEPQGKKGYFPQFQKNQQVKSIGKPEFYKKFQSPEPSNKTSKLTSSGDNNFRDFITNRPRVDSKASSYKEPYKPLQFKKSTQMLKNQKKEVIAIRKYSDDLQSKDGNKQDSKSTLNTLGKNSIKIPKFLQKNSSGLSERLQISQPLVGSCQNLQINKNTWNQLPQSPLQKRLNAIDNGKTFDFNNNVVVSQNVFAKKKPTDFSSAFYAKIAKTPQSNPVKPEISNFQFGRLSSPSSFNNRRRVEPAKKQFSLQDFQLIQKIGKGAFGDVFTAIQKASGWVCVVKKVSKRKIKEQKLEDTILRQIKIQAYLQHKHLTQFYGFFNDQQYVYLILQILPHGSMSQVKKKKKLAQPLVSRYIKQVCQGLRYMHKQNVIHRDLKPQNIFLNEDYIKIGDFGCAVHTNTLRNTMVGCIAYISPEQLNNDFYDDKIDVWGLGIMTYELITGKPPFQSDIIKISRQQIQPKLSQLIFPEDLEISSDCKHFISQLLQKNPQDRMSVQQAIRHPFITKYYGVDRKQQQQIFGRYQNL